MPQRGGKPRPPTPWMKYLKDIQDRPGWSIARVARESGGRISRATLFRMMTGDTKRVTIETVRLVAQIVGDDPDTVLSTASGSLAESDEREDSRLDGLDPNDEVVQHILSLDVDDEMKQMILDRHRDNLERDRQRYIEQVQREVDMWQKRYGAA